MNNNTKQAKQGHKILKVSTELHTWHMIIGKKKAVKSANSWKSNQSSQNSQLLKMQPKSPTNEKVIKLAKIAN